MAKKKKDRARQRTLIMMSGDYNDDPLMVITVGSITKKDLDAVDQKAYELCEYGFQEMETAQVADAKDLLKLVKKRMDEDE